MTLSSIFEQVAGKPVEDRTYNIGEISQKTGLLKTANGWVEPPKGKAPGAKTGPGTTKIKKAAENGGSSNADVSLASKDVKEVVEKIKPADGAEKTELSKITQFMDEEKSSLKNAIEARESFYKNTKNPTSEQEAGLAALLRIKNKIGKQPDTGLSGEKKTISYREMGEGPLYVKKEASDSAPRVLTGDCKVRIRK